MTWIAAAEGVDPQAFDTEEAAEAARVLMGPRAIVWRLHELGHGTEEEQG
jgi:hypothetical protein